MDYWEEGGNCPQNDNHRHTRLFWLLILLGLFMLILCVYPAMAQSAMDTLLQMQQQESQRDDANMLRLQMEEQTLQQTYGAESQQRQVQGDLSRDEYNAGEMRIQQQQRRGY